MSNRFGPAYPHLGALDALRPPVNHEHRFPDRPVIPTRDAYFDDSFDPFATSERPPPREPGEQRLEASIEAARHGYAAPQNREAAEVLGEADGPCVELPRWLKGIIKAFQAAGWIMLLLMVLAMIGGTAGHAS